MYYLGQINPGNTPFRHDTRTRLELKNFWPDPSLWQPLSCTHMSSLFWKTSSSCWKKSSSYSVELEEDWNQSDKIGRFTTFLATFNLLWLLLTYFG